MFYHEKLSDYEKAIASCQTKNDKPKLIHIISAPNTMFSVAELPYGWEKVEDPHYGTYYIE